MLDGKGINLQTGKALIDYKRNRDNKMNGIDGENIPTVSAEFKIKYTYTKPLKANVSLIRKLYKNA